MIGVILAAGCARRLRPLTDNKPKCLLDVGGRTLLQRTVDAMRAAGICEFVIVTGYRAAMLRQHLAEYVGADIDGEDMLRGQGLTFRFLDNTDYENNNNIYSLWMAGQVVRGREFLLMDSDILCDPEAVRRIADSGDDALALNRHELGEEEIKIIVDDDGRILEINKTCDPRQAIGESVGIEHITAAYSTALYDELESMILREGLVNVFYEQAFERLIKRGHTFRIIETTDLFSFEIDTPEDYARAQELISQNKL